MNEKDEKADLSAKKQLVRGRPFPKGVSGNPAGRPLGSIDPVKEIGRKIAETRIKTGIPVSMQRKLKKQGIVIDDDNQLTMLELIMIELATSGNPAKLQMFLERTYGKTANVNINQNNTFDFMKHANKFTDAELMAIKEGADPLEILFSKLPDINEDNA